MAVSYPKVSLAKMHWIHCLGWNFQSYVCCNSPFWMPFCWLMLLTCSSSKEGDKVLKGKLERNSARFTDTLHHYVKTQQTLHTDFVYQDSFHCVLKCLVNVECSLFSFKLQTHFGRKHLCELLTSDKFGRAEFHHYSILVGYRFPSYKNTILLCF